MRVSYPIVVLISGNGSNLQSMIQAASLGLPLEIRAVISNEPSAFGLIRANEAGIPTHVVNHRDYPSRDTFEEALLEQIDIYNPALIALAGFMRHLTPNFVDYFYGHLINIHPSLLPKYPGLHTHQRVLEAGDKIHGTSIHYVSAEVDGGPIICQAQITVTPQDTADTLKERIQKIEHVIYPEVLDWIASDRLTLINNKVHLDQIPIPENGIQLRDLPGQ